MTSTLSHHQLGQSSIRQVFTSSVEVSTAFPLYRGSCFPRTNLSIYSFILTMEISKECIRLMHLLIVINSIASNATLHSLTQGKSRNLHLLHSTQIARTM